MTRRGRKLQSTRMGAAKDRRRKRGIAKPFSSPGGKEAWRGLILQRLPDHDVYVEPYAGSATIFFAKQRAKVEVLADVNPDIVATYVFLRDGTDEDFTWMREQSWEWSPITFKRLKNASPKSRREKVYRFKYLNLFSRRGQGDVLNTTDRARASTGKVFLRNLEKFRERLEGVKIFEADALEVISKFDSAKTFFYLDPPWKPVGVGDEWKDFDADAFKGAIEKMKGRAIVSFQGEIDLPEPWRKVTIASALGGVGTTSEQHILINFDPPNVEKFGIHQDPSGMHGHDMDREAGTTGVRTFEGTEPEFRAGEPDGPHSHLFVIGGMVVETECDGSHVHNISAADAETTDEDGEHTHRIPTASGPIETNAGVSAHSHRLEVTDRTAWGDGWHQHTLDHEGETITSLTPAEFWSMFVQGQGDEDEETDSDEGEEVEQRRRRKPYEKDAEGISKPFANEHRARQADPDQFDSFRRGQPEGFPDSVEAIFGITEDGSQIQSVVFDASQWTESSAKEWLSEHDFKTSGFEAATGKFYPRKRDPVPAHVHQHFVGADHFLAVRVKFDDKAIGWSLATMRASLPGTETVKTVDAMKRAAETCSPYGDRFTRPIVDARVLAAKGAPSAGKAIRIDTLRAEYGMQAMNVREIFLTKGSLFSGVLRLEVVTTNDGKNVWTSKLEKRGVPLALTHESVVSKWMPPDGFSALPLSIEKMIPPEFRYWLYSGETARKCRDALVEAQIVRDCVLVDGEFRTTRTKTYVEPFPDFADRAIKPATPKPAITKAAGLARWPGKPLLVGPGLADSVGPDDLVSKLSTVGKDYLVAWPDSAYTREVFAELGRPFVLKHRPGLLFVASRPLANVDPVEFVDKFSIETELARLEGDAKLVSANKKIAKLYDSLTKREIPIYFPHRAGVKKDGEEERFVLGIVLEPDEVDAQNDIYTSDEIRKAAHGFMEFHGNRGVMHTQIANDKMVILESTITRVAEKLVDPKGRERTVKVGTWLLAYGIRDDDLWTGVKRGEFNGFSIGGSAVRRPRA